MTSATDEIRAELTRLGVDWANRDSFNDYKTVWHHDHTSYLFIESIFYSDRAILKVRKPTPAQAIAATLGTGTCKRVMDSIDPFAMWVCDHCGHPLDTSENFCGGCGRKVVDE